LSIGASQVACWWGFQQRETGLWHLRRQPCFPHQPGWYQGVISDPLFQRAVAELRPASAGGIASQTFGSPASPWGRSWPRLCL